MSTFTEMCKAYRDGRHESFTDTESGLVEMADRLGDAFPAWFAGRYEEGHLAVITPDGKIYGTFKTQSVARQVVTRRDDRCILNLVTGYAEYRADSAWRTTEMSFA